MASALDDAAVNGTMRGSVPVILKIATVIACLLAIAVTIAIALAERRSRIEEAGREARDAARLAAAELYGVLQAVEVVLHQAIAISGPPDQPIRASREAWDELVALSGAAPFIEALWFGGPDGAALLSTHQFPAPALSASDRDYFIVQRDHSPGLFIAAVQRDRYTAEPTFVASRRLERPDGSFRGFVTVTVSPQPFLKALRRAEAFPASLMRADGVSLIATPARADAEGTLDRNFSAAATASPSGVYRDNDLDGEERLVVFEKLEPFALYARVDVALNPITDAWFRNRFPAYALIGLASLLSILTWHWVALSRTRKAEVSVQTLERVRLGLEERINAHTDSLRRANQRLAEAVADKEVLYREVHHRVKNNLQVVSSLLQLQSARLAPDVRRPFEESLTRISAMSLVHEILYRSDQPSRIDFARYLGALAEAVISRRGLAGRVSTNLESEPILMDLDRAVPLALLVNELIGYIVDHAFPQDRAGSLGLRLSRDPTGAQLAILHDGLESTHMPTGFGLLLVDALSGQIGASVLPQHGVRNGFLLIVPLPAAAPDQSRAAS
jgi:two-component system, sensor histidine kinase PdtaS